MQHGTVQGLIKEATFLRTAAQLTLTIVVVCSNWHYSEREESTFFELLLFYKVILRMFGAVCLFTFGIFRTCFYHCHSGLGLTVHLPWSASSLLFPHRRYFLLLECHAYMSCTFITWAATSQDSATQNRVLHSLCTRQGSRHCTETHVCHSVSRQQAGHCARGCWEPSTSRRALHNSMPRMCAWAVGQLPTVIWKEGCILQSSPSLAS